MTDYRHKKSGVIYHVKNGGLLSLYEGGSLFEKIEEKPPTKTKKTSQKPKGQKR